jgi:hypothetical protein
MAYDLYPQPAARAGGDSDVQVAHRHLDAPPRPEGANGFHPATDDATDPFRLQECWVAAVDGGAAHHVDLHWQLLNAPALAQVLPPAACLTRPRPLPRLSAEARAMARTLMLVHACIHRAQHVTAPYFVGGRQYHGGDRLVWLYDLHLLCAALSAAEWAETVSLAATDGVAATCLDGLAAARRELDSAVPASVLHRLAQAKAQCRGPAYLRARQFGRAWEDLKAISGLRRKIHFMRARALPDAGFMRAKSPRLAALPLPLLYARRVIDLVRPRREQDWR